MDLLLNEFLEFEIINKAKIMYHGGSVCAKRIALNDWAFKLKTYIGPTTLQFCRN
jgi:hypothetical protein